MNNHNLKKRRPHGHGESFSISHSSSSVVPLSLTTSTSSSSSSLTTTLSSQHSIPSQTFFGSSQHTPQELQILHQAASLLHCHIDQLLALDQRPHHPNYQDHPLYTPTASKRQRRDTDNIKTSPSEVKSPSLSHYNEMPSGFFRAPGLHSSMSEETQGFARCLTSITSCSPCSIATYDAPAYVPAPVMHDYPYMQEKLPYRDDEPSSSQYQASSVHMDPYRTVELETPTLSSYPALQPSRAMITQPSTRTETMVYHNLGANCEHAEHQHTDTHAAANHMCLTQPANESETHGLDVDQYEAMRPTQPQGSPVFGNAETSRELDIVLSSQRPPAAKRGPFRSNDERERTAETRKIGSCIRCRMQRIRCEIDPDDKHGTCLTCQRVSSVKIWRLPCLRYKITDVRLFKPGPVKGYEWTRRWTEGVPGDISLWESPDTKWVRVTEGYTNHSIMLRVRKFVPQDGDSLSRTWVANGQKREVQIPAYAIVNLDEAKSAYNEYIKSGYFDCCKSILRSKAKLLHATYMMAMKAAQDRQTPEKERELLTKALRLWMAIRLTTKSTVIVGNETLGMTRDIMDQTSPLHGQIPLPPVMGAQIELVLIHQIQSALRRELLENLQAMTQANKHKTWFTTYLVTFILLHNVALLCQHDAGYARKHGIKTRFARQDMVQEYQIGANILLAYYHYCTKGVYPFSPDCKDQDLSTLAELDESKTKVVLATRKVVKEHRNQWAKIRQSADYENDMFYISQLYEEQWSPLPTI